MSRSTLPTPTLAFSTGELQTAIRAAGGVRAVELATGERLAIPPGDQATVGALLSTMDDLLSPEQAAQLLSVSRPMVVRWIREGLLEDQPVGTHHRISLHSVLALRDQRSAASRRARELVDAAGNGDDAAAARTRAARERAAKRVANRGGLPQ